MKIALAANTAWYLYNFRAALVEAIKQRGWEPVLISPTDRYVEEFTQMGIRHIPWELGRQTTAPWKELASVREIRQIYEREQFDLVHHHTMKAVIYGSLAAGRTGTLVVNSIPGRGYVYSSVSLKAALLKPVVTALLRLAFRKNLHQQLIFENREDMTFFLDKGLVPESTTSLIPSVGVDTKRFQAAPLPEGVFTVGFVGRMLRDKGVEVFVNAARLLHEWGVPCQMVLIGGPDPGNADSVGEGLLREWDQLENVAWWGWLEDMQEGYARIHALAQPTSYGEGVPTTLVEAAAVKRAVIASDWPGCREVITDGQTGLLVPPRDPQALALAIKRLVEDQVEFDRLRENVHQFAMDKFRRDDVNFQTLVVYEKLLPRVG